MALPIGNIIPMATGLQAHWLHALQRDRSLPVATVVPFSPGSPF